MFIIFVRKGWVGDRYKNRKWTALVIETSRKRKVFRL